MSKFSDQLSQAIKLSGKSKNQIIEESKINRSSFFQFLNGKRMPTKEHLAAILAALQLTPGEEEQLRKLYEIAEIGENIYESRVGCAECLDDLALLTGQNRRPIHEFVGEAVYSVSRAPILGENRVYQELCHLAQAEMLKPEPKIDLFLPRQPNDFLKYLKSFFQNKSNKKIRMRQIIQFSLNQEEKTKDILSFFNSLLFLMAVSGDSYEAYYYYSDSNLTDTIGALYPYCVMTSSGACWGPPGWIGRCSPLLTPFWWPATPSSRRPSAEPSPLSRISAAQSKRSLSMASGISGAAGISTSSHPALAVICRTRCCGCTRPRPLPR